MVVVLVSVKHCDDVMTVVMIKLGLNGDGVGVV